MASLAGLAVRPRAYARPRLASLLWIIAENMPILAYRAAGADHLGLALAAAALVGGAALMARGARAPPHLASLLNALAQLALGE